MNKINNIFRQIVNPKFNSFCINDEAKVKEEIARLENLKSELYGIPKFQKLNEVYTKSLSDFKALEKHTVLPNNESVSYEDYKKCEKQYNKALAKIEKFKSVERVINNRINSIKIAQHNHITKNLKPKENIQKVASKNIVNTLDKSNASLNSVPENVK